jgi:hypothetical protein
LDTKLLSANQQTAVEALAASAGRMDKRVGIASVVRAFTALAPAAPVAVMLQAGRLHMHFRQPAHMLAASTAVPAFVRCCLASCAWSQRPHGCDGERHDALEMLAFTCHPASGADMPDGVQLMQRVKELVVQEMGYCR